LRLRLRTQGAGAARLSLSVAATNTHRVLTQAISDIQSIREEFGVAGLSIEHPANLYVTVDELVRKRDVLTRFLSVRSVKAEAEEQGLAAFLAQADHLGIANNLLPRMFAGLVAQKRGERIRRHDPILSNATGQQLQSSRNEFRLRDERKKDRDRQAVFNKVVENRPLSGSSFGPKRTWTEGEKLNNEFGKQAGFRPLRELMSLAGKSIQAMKPCFMMSPLSLAKFLPATSLSFDLLVIDEASQMRPEDALGGLLRAKQVIVVGDPKQLPPTDFFRRSASDGRAGDDDDGNDGDDESILEACHKTFRQLRLLRWHYRSRCESLIAFSNREIYAPEGRRLITFPAARAGSFSIDRIRVQGVYEARRNPPEAQRIAEEAVRFMREHARLDKPPTIGLVAMNADQTELIDEELRLLISGDETVERYRTKVGERGEPVFVKNLENVQGDERDFILISLTYGPRPGEKVVLQRFGPILGKHGHRRLNVLFTRARMRIGLVSSMDSDDIKPSETASRGVHLLRNYLAYVETAGRDSGSVTGREPDSDFEIYVARALKDRGYNVACQVGVSGFRIDLAVLHPQHEKHFLAGIECDGAQYHSSKSARDRDRLREEVLEGLGWTILRVWSTDWFDNPDHQADLLDKKLRDLATGRQPPHPLYTFAREVHVAGDAASKGRDVRELFKSGEGAVESSAKPYSKQVQIELFGGAQSRPGSSMASETLEPLTRGPNPRAGEAEREGETDVSELHGSPASPDKEPVIEPWKRDAFTPSEVRVALAAFRDAVIAKAGENWEPERSILRSGLIETFVEQRVTDDGEWFRKVPLYMRRNTNAAEKRRFFDDICEIVARIKE
jgi:very-short-patch-repair endonuclease